MKKLFSLVCAVLLAVSAQAQLVTSRSRSMIETPKEDRLMWVLRAGIGTNNVILNDVETGSKFGYTFSIEFNRSIGRQGAYWGMDWGLGSRGYIYDYDDGEETLTAHNISWSPYTFGWKIKIANTKFAIDPHVSVFLSYDYTGTFEQKGLFGSNDFSIYDEEDYFGFDVGIKFGVGVWYNNRFNLDLMYQRGFIPPFENSDNGGASNFMVRFGLGF